MATKLRLCIITGSSFLGASWRVERLQGMIDASAIPGHNHRGITHRWNQGRDSSRVFPIRARVRQVSAVVVAACVVACRVAVLRVHLSLLREHARAESWWLHCSGRSD